MDLDTLAFEIETAATVAHTAIAGLTLSNGGPKYVPEEEARLRNEAVAGFDRTIASVLAAVDDEINEYEQAAQEAERRQAMGPISRMSDAQLARANSLDRFVRQDAQSLPVSQLNDRLRAVIAGGDEVQVALHHRHAAGRLQFERKGEEVLNRDDLLELSTLVADLGDRLVDPTVRRKRQAAQEVATAGRAFKGKANLLRQQLTGRNPTAEALGARGEYARY